MPSATGTVTKVNSDPKGFTVETSPGPPPVTTVFTPVSDTQYATALAAWVKGAEVKVTYAMGPPVSVTNVESPP